MSNPAGTLMVTPDIGSGRSFGTEKLTVVTAPVVRNCGTGTTWADAPLDVTRVAARTQAAMTAERTRGDNAHDRRLSFVARQTNDGRIAR